MQGESNDRSFILVNIGLCLARFAITCICYPHQAASGVGGRKGCSLLLHRDTVPLASRGTSCTLQRRSDWIERRANRRWNHVHEPSPREQCLSIAMPAYHHGQTFVSPSFVRVTLPSGYQESQSGTTGILSSYFDDSSIRLAQGF